MPSPRLPRIAAAVALGAAALLTVACAATPEPGPTPVDAATDAAVDPAPVATPAPAETTAPEPEKPLKVTCDTLISADLLADLEAQGWTAKEEPFAIGEATFDDGVSCMWGDFSTATGNVLIFAWAPVTAAETEAAQAQLEADGWIRETGDAGVYYTEDPSLALNVDENGYGMTYLFADDSVTLSDTKQGLLLIEDPTA